MVIFVSYFLALLFSFFNVRTTQDPKYGIEYQTDTYLVQPNSL